MKPIIKYLLFFCLLFGLKATAQEPGDSRPLASNSSIGGRKELKREKKVKKQSYRNAKEQERKAWKKSPNNKKFKLGKKSRKKVKKNKEKRNKDKPKDTKGDAY
ncbi:MAG: hypothetical protein K0S12_682 [Bacteroidetes bacterium]|jgi:hypothetical protein|nr:hypothetical protein [Bacteroidota bacterium]